MLRCTLVLLLLFCECVRSAQMHKLACCHASYAMDINVYCDIWPCNAYSCTVGMFRM
jgi:hypothetical protein